MQATTPEDMYYNAIIVIKSSHCTLVLHDSLLQASTHLSWCKAYHSLDKALHKLFPSF